MLKNTTCKAIFFTYIQPRALRCCVGCLTPSTTVNSVINGCIYYCESLITGKKLRSN